jgi:hypothetical protein
MAPSYFRNKALLFCFIAAAEAYKIFETSCSTPTTQVNFVSSPDSRGTLDILWSSLFTIVACTWTVQHLNIPEQRNGRDPGRVGGLRWKLKRFLTSAKWMLITMIAPEVVIGMACYDFTSANESLRKLRKFALEDNVPWTLSHSYYANMGGFVIQSGVQEAPHGTPYITTETAPADNHPDMTDMAIVDSSGSQAQKVVEPKEKSLPTTIPENGKSYSYHNPYHLRATQIYKLRDKRVLPKLPHISEEELEDKSKSDSFVKTIAVFQIIWATIQIIVRTARKLAISQLELAVIAFAACAVVIYLLYWSKPKSASATITILRYQDQIPKDVLKLIKDPTVRIGSIFLQDINERLRRGSRIQNDAMEEEEDNENGWVVTLALTLGAALFGGIHIGAWNFDFPSRIELIFWRCASVYSAAYGPGLLVYGIVIDWFFGENKEKINKIFVPLLTFLYIIARLYLLIDIFRTLCFLPPGAYTATWATNIPHVS